MHSKIKTNHRRAFTVQMWKKWQKDREITEADVKRAIEIEEFRRTLAKPTDFVLNREYWK